MYSALRADILPPDGATDKCNKVFDMKRHQAVLNHVDILKLASNITFLTKQADALAWKISQLDLLHKFLHVIDQLEQLSDTIQLGRRWYSGACGALRAGHLSRDVLSDDLLFDLLALLSRTAFVMAPGWYRHGRKLH